MKKNYDFSIGLRGAHRDQTFTILGPVKSDAAEPESKAAPAKATTVTTKKTTKKTVV